MKKTPKLFKKAYTKKQLEKKLIRRLSLPQDREFVKRLFREAPETGKWILRDDLSPEEKKKLPGLAKWIRKNRGFVTRWKAVVLLILAAAVLVFNLLFKDMLVKRLLEAGLETVFRSEVTVEEPSFRLLRGTFSFQSLTIADAEDESRNLLETEEGLFYLDMAELTRKRLRIVESSLSGVRTGTSRTASGTAAAEDTARDDGGNSGFSLSSLAPGTEDFDFQALIEEQKDSLAVTRLIDEGNQEIRGLEEKWTAAFAEQQTEISALAEEAAAFKDVKPSEIGSVAEAGAAVQDIQSVYRRVNSKKNELKDLREDFQADRERVSALGRAVTAGFEEDYDRLKGQLDFSSGGAKTLISDLAETYIRNRWNSYFEGGLKGRELYRKYRENRDDSPKKDIPRRSRGTTYLFPSPDAPLFLAELVSLTGEAGGDQPFRLEARDISSDPDVLGRPVTFSAGLGLPGEALELQGILDLRRGAEEAFSMTLQGPPRSFSLDREAEALQLSSLSGAVSFLGEARYRSSDEKLVTEIDLTFTEIQTVPAGAGVVSDAVSRILGQVDLVEMETRIIAGLEEVESVHVSTDLDNLLADRVGDYLDEKAEELEEELRARLKDYLEEQLAEQELLKSGLDSLGVESLDQISTVEGLETVLNNKKKEVESVADAYRKELEAEARQKVEEAEAQARREAEARAREAAESLVPGISDSLSIPGF